MAKADRLQTRLTDIQEQITVFSTAIKTQNLARLKSYSSGFGLKSTTYQDLEGATKYLKWLYSEEERIEDQIAALNGEDTGNVQYAECLWS